MRKGRITRLLLIAAAAGCGEDQMAPIPPTVLRVEVHTWGDDVDLDGYMVRVDGGSGQAIAPNGELLVEDLKPGPHLVELTGAGPNCVVAPRDVRPVSLAEADTTSLSFEVTCQFVGVRVSVATTGLDPDPSMTLLVDGVAYPTPLTSTGVTDVGRLSPGPHRFQLTGLAPNCTMANPAERLVTLAAGSLIPLEFSVACVAATGALQVTVNTDGLDLDPNGYSVFVDGRAARSVGINGSVVITSLAAGSHPVRLEAVDGNCQVVGENSRTVIIVAGRAVRDTTSTGFTVSCTKFYELAFNRNGRIRLARMDGMNSADFANGWQPAWSPDGQRLAYHCGQICVTGLDGGGTSVLETGDLVDLGSWSPDGTRLVFVSYNCDDYYTYGCVLNGLFTIRADGTAMTRITLPPAVHWVSAPDWSPDGSLIAFACSISATPNGICVVAPNGDGFRVVTQPAEGIGSSDPSWSPDGSRIAFARWSPAGSLITLMNADGTGLVPTDSHGWAPEWTPDGSRILFTAVQCSGGCDQVGIASIKADGTGRIGISTDRNDYGPSARP